MSTNSIITAETGGGETLAAGYFHWDGFPETVLPSILTALEGLPRKECNAVQILAAVKVSRRAAEWMTAEKVDNTYVDYRYGIRVQKDGVPVVVLYGRGGQFELVGVTTIGGYAVKGLNRWADRLEEDNAAADAAAYRADARGVVALVERLAAAAVLNALEDLAGVGV